jgi:cell division protein FtsB
MEKEPKTQTKKNDAVKSAEYKAAVAALFQKMDELKAQESKQTAEEANRNNYAVVPPELGPLP